MLAGQLFLTFGMNVVSVAYPAAYCLAHAYREAVAVSDADNAGEEDFSGRNEDAAIDQCRNLHDRGWRQSAYLQTKQRAHEAEPHEGVDGCQSGLHLRSETGPRLNLSCSKSTVAVADPVEDGTCLLL